MYQRWGGGTSHAQFIEILAVEMSKPKEQRPIHEAFLSQHDRLAEDGQIRVSLWLREDELRTKIHHCPGLLPADCEQLPLASTDFSESGIDVDVIQKIKDIYLLDYSTFGFDLGS